MSEHFISEFNYLTVANSNNLEFTQSRIFDSLGCQQQRSPHHSSF